jgi:hypothetical protein
MHQTPFVWLELKRRQGSRSQKQRVRVERGRVDDWVAGRASDGGAEGDAIRAYCQGLDETLKPFALVNYRRSSWQSADDTLRVTVDSELFFFTAMPDIWGRPSLSRSSLGQPRKREARLLVEVKQRGDEQPAWLARTLVQLHAEPVTYSKFMRAMESATG